MRYKGYNRKLSLTGAGIDESADVITGFLKDIKTEKREILRLRLSVEEILLNWQNHFGEDKDVELACFSYFGQPTVQLKLAGEPFDPLKHDDDDTYGTWSRKLLSGLQSTPMYSYSRNANVVTFKLVRKRLSPVFMLLCAILAAVLVGFAGAQMPEGIREVAVSGVLTPICDTYINVINFFGIPLIFLSVMLGICGIGDSSSFEYIGKKMIGHFMLSLSMITVATAVISYPFYSFTHGQGSVDIAYGDFLDMILGFLPTNLFKPFIDCNAMQLIIMGVVFGIAILKLEPGAHGIFEMFDQLNEILLLVSGWVTRIIPFFVFIILVKSIWAGETEQILLTWKSWLLVMLLQLISAAALIAAVCIRNKVSVATVVKKLTATFIIALGTNSCGATIPEIFSATGRLGVNPQMMLFGIPIGTSIYKPACAIRIIVLSYFFASMYDVEVSFQWFVMAVLMAIILSIAVPAIPGGMMIFYPMLFSQLGIPEAAISIMLAVDILFDAPSTAFCMVDAELALADQAGKLDMLDKETLGDRISLI